ncbi:MAG: TrkA family potassium uptake protein [candidate division WOR-3 bacterium]|nr:MAG: TrkA family potassium uptake protein [candidate division WOR-3 bacterium]
MAQFAVIGLGAFGRKVALTLAGKGADVIAIDKNKDSVEEIKDQVSAAIVLDSTDEEAMKAAEILDVDAAVVALGDNQEEAILITAILKKLGISRIYARAINQLYAHVLKSVGADTVIVIEEQMGEDLAKRLLSPEIYQHVVLTTGHSLVEIEARPDFIGKSLRELDFRKNYGLNIIAIQRRIPKVNDDGKITYTVEVNDVPGPDDRIGKGDIIVVVGADENLERMSISAKEKK